jgi:hypothetical protein
VCRSMKQDGGRRCPGCGSYSAAAKANSNRRLGRLARLRVVEHLTSLGLTETARVIQAAPPSILPEFMRAVGIDESVLQGVRMPHTHSRPPSAGFLIAVARAERAGVAASSQLAPVTDQVDCGPTNVGRRSACGG